MGFFEKMFGNKPVQNQQQTYQKLDFVNSFNTTFYSWDGNLFQNDIVRSCIRPKVNAISKLNAKHIRGTGQQMQINPDGYIRQILERPNPYMSMQELLMKLVWQRELNHNAFAYVKRDEFGYPMEIYPIPANSVEMLEKNGEVFAKFRFRGGKWIVIPYCDLIHVKKDFNNNEMFGEGGVQSLETIMNVITTTDQGIVSAIKNSALIKWMLKFSNNVNPIDKQREINDFASAYLNLDTSTGVAATDSKFDAQQIKQENYVPPVELVSSAVKRLYSYFGVNEAIVTNKYTEDEYQAFYEAEIEPIIIQLSNAFTYVFFTQRERGFNNKIVFEGSNLVFGSLTTKLALVSMVDRGALTPNEWRAVLGYAPVIGGDVPIRRLDTAMVEDEKPNTNQVENIEESEEIDDNQG